MKEPKTKMYNILIIEDSDIDFHIANFHLQNAIKGATIIQAENFETAQAILNTTNNVFDVVLLDLHLPDSEGELLVGVSPGTSAVLNRHTISCNKVIATLETDYLSSYYWVIYCKVTKLFNGRFNNMIR